jgi:hydrogenase maturation protease
MTDPSRIGVLGVGNVLMGDDGIGPFIINILEARYEFPPNVVLHDIGTPGLGIISFFSEYDVIILIDAVSSKDAPGTIRLYRKPQLVRVSLPQRVSPHDPALIEALLFAELSGKCPREVLLVGVIPQATELGCSLTPAVRSAVLPVIDEVLTELHRLGASPQPRAGAAVPSISWEEKVVSDSPPMEA